MKKARRAFFLCACLLMALAFGTAGAARLNRAASVLANEGDDAFWDLVIPKYARQPYISQDQACLSVWSPDSPVVPAIIGGEDWPQCQYTVMIRETNGVGFHIGAVDTYVCEMYKGIFPGYSFNLPMDTYIPAYGTFSIENGSPRIGNPRYEALVVSGTDDNGNELEFYGIVERLNYTAPAEKPERGPQAGAEGAVTGIPFYAAGDMLALEDGGEKGYAKVNGIEYLTNKTLNCDSSFEPAIFLYSSTSLSYVRDRFPLELNEEPCRDMQSVYLGDIMIDLPHKMDAVKIARCVEENGKLRVVSVMNNQYNYYERAYLTRNEAGNWQASPTYWFLIHYQMGGKTFYEFFSWACGVE